MAAASAAVTFSGGRPASSTYPPPRPACAQIGTPAWSSASTSRLTVADGHLEPLREPRRRAPGTTRGAQLLGDRVQPLGPVHISKNAGKR